MSSMLHPCQHINAPIKPEKVVPPTTRITFLDIVIDATTMTANIADDRKASILEELLLFRSSKKCKRNKRQLLLLIGKLSFAGKVVASFMLLN